MYYYPCTCSESASSNKMSNVPIPNPHGMAWHSTQDQSFSPTGRTTVTSNPASSMTRLERLQSTRKSPELNRQDHSSPGTDILPSSSPPVVTVPASSASLASCSFKSAIASSVFARIVSGELTFFPNCLDVKRQIIQCFFFSSFVVPPSPFSFPWVSTSDPAS